MTSELRNIMKRNSVTANKSRILNNTHSKKELTTTKLSVISLRLLLMIPSGILMFTNLSFTSIKQITWTFKQIKYKVAS